MAKEVRGILAGLFLRAAQALLLFIGLSVGHVYAQSTPPFDRNVVLHAAIANKQREFHIGELIPLQLNFSSSGQNHYELNIGQSDRSDVMDHEHFNISPSVGWVDPLPEEWLTFGGGGLSILEHLNSEPSTIKLNLNEWVRFTQPGEYRLTIFSSRVGIRDASGRLDIVTAQSNEIKLKIVKADPVWQQRIFKEAVVQLDVESPRESSQSELSETTRRALETLRFLGSADATRELVKRMLRGGCGADNSICTLGVILSPERSVARAALEEAVADPNQPINGNLAFTFRILSSDTLAFNANWQETEQKVVEQLLAALPAKRGKALSITLSTTLSEAWSLNTLPQQTTERLTAQLVSLFDELPLNERNILLSSRWEKIKSPALVPVLKRYVQPYDDSREMQGEPSYELRQLSANALRGWYDLDPEGARSAIITEIGRARPRFDARVLGLLSDKTLPEVDFVLAAHFRSIQDESDRKSNLASLIARYATDAILPEIIEQLDPKIGKWSCSIQNPLLAYVLRVSPESGRDLIEKAIAARGDAFSGCYHNLLPTVAEIHYNPLLEEIGIKSLDDPDAHVAATAATMLGKFGSPVAETPLLKRYASWSEQWAGRETELDQNFVVGNESFYQLELGENLIQALTTSKSWVLDKATLQRLAQQTTVRRIREQLESHLRSAEQ